MTVERCRRARNIATINEERPGCDNRSVVGLQLGPCIGVIVQEARMQDHHTRDEVGPRPVARATSPSANLTLLLISLLSSLLVIEIGYRFVAGLPVVKWTNWRVDAVSANRLGERAVFDPVIGWSVKP